MFQKDRYEDITVSTVITLIVLLLAVYGFIFSDRGYLNYEKLKQKEQTLNREIDALESKKVFMRQRILSLESDPYLYESIAREKLEMVKPNETVFKIEYTIVDE